MAVHHVAFACRDLEATHRFYTEAMGFTLAKVEATPTPAASPTGEEAGWARHLFYDTGAGFVAFWDLHDGALPDPIPAAISTDLGLPNWVNHLAFDAVDLDGIAAARQRWLDTGHDVGEIDHGWCTSIYAVDPNGILVEWCATTRPLTGADRADALQRLTAERPPLSQPPPMIVHRSPVGRSAATAGR